MITIDQLLESVDLDFEPRWVTKDEMGVIELWEEKPNKTNYGCWSCYGWQTRLAVLKLAEFENKPWSECIYQVPRKTTGKIEKFVPENDRCGNIEWWDVVNKINELVDAVNELKERTEPKKLTGFAKTLSDLDMSKPMSTYTNKGGEE